jgi:hypothetical protein
MDAKQVRKILDEVCANLDRRRARLQLSILGRYVQPVGLGLALGLGGVGGCGSDGRLSPEGDGSPSDARVDAGGDIGLDLPPSQDLYGEAVDVQWHDVNQDSRPEVGQPVDLYGLVVDARVIIDSPPDVYGIADRAFFDTPDARVVLDSPPDLYGIANREVLPPIDSPADIYAAADRAVEKPAVDAGVETASPIDAQPVDGSTKD